MDNELTEPTLGFLSDDDVGVARLCVGECAKDPIGEGSFDNGELIE